MHIHSNPVIDSCDCTAMRSCSTYVKIGAVEPIKCESFVIRKMQKENEKCKRIEDKLLLEDRIATPLKLQLITITRALLYRECYTTGYEFYLRVVKTMFYERMQRVSTMLF